MRPAKTTVDYFPHDTATGKTLFTLERMYGNDGYAVWFKTLELLGRSTGHVYEFSSIADWTYLVACYGVDEEKATAILQTLADLGAIDPDLHKEKTIWSDNLITRLQGVYDKRSTEIPCKPGFRGENSSDEELLEVSGEKTPQSKVKESKGKESKEKTSPPYREIISHLNEKTKSKFKHTSKATREHINARWREGFTLDDFFAVIDTKSDEWMNDKKMFSFLRPATLFGTKFEGYLQAAGKRGDGQPSQGKTCATCDYELRGQCPPEHKKKMLKNGDACCTGWIADTRGGR